MKQFGFTLIELIITIAILSFGIIGVYSAFLPIANVQHTMASKVTAVYLAQEGFEIVRNIRDHNPWPAGLAQCSLGCQADYKMTTLKLYNEQSYLNISADGFYSYDQGNPTKFKRKITITQAGSPDVLKVDVLVMWDYNGKPMDFEITTYLYNVK